MNMRGYIRMGLENELRKLIIEGLKLEDVSPEDIGDETPLFGEGLELDSLDAVELVVLLKKQYGVEIKEMEVAREAFRNLRTLSDFIEANKSD